VNGPSAKKNLFYHISALQWGKKGLSHLALLSIKGKYFFEKINFEDVID